MTARPIRMAQLLPALGTASASRRRRAAEKIAALGRLAVPDLVIALRAHPNAYVRSGAVTVLALIGDGSAPRALRAAALRDPAMTVRLHALGSLDRGWTAAHAPTIIRMLGDTSGGVRVNAIDVLLRRGERRAAPALLGLLSDGKWYVRQHAAVALGRLGIERARGALRTRALVDPRKAVRDAAARAIEQIEGIHSTSEGVSLLATPESRR